MAYYCDDTGRRGCTPQPGYSQTTYPICTPQAGYIPTMNPPTGFNAFANEPVTNYDNSYTGYTGYTGETYTFEDMTSMQTSMQTNMCLDPHLYTRNVTNDHVDMTKSSTRKEPIAVDESQSTQQTKKNETRKDKKSMIVYGALIFGVGLFCGLFAYHIMAVRLRNDLEELQDTILEFQKNAEELRKALGAFQELTGY